MYSFSFSLTHISVRRFGEIKIKILTKILTFQLRKDPRIELHWPILKFFENKMFMPTNFYGVELNKSEGNSDGFDAISSIQVVHLVYHIAGTEKVGRVSLDTYGDTSHRDMLLPTTCSNGTCSFQLTST